VRCALLCAAVRCCALRVLGIRRHALCSGLDATRTHSSPRRGLPPRSAPCKISSKHKQQRGFRAATARVGHRHPRRRTASRAARELNLSTAGFCFRSSTSSATGLNLLNSRRALRMRRVGSHTGPANSVNGQVCDASRGHPRRRIASSAARGVGLIHRGVLLQVVHQQRHRAEPVQLLPRVPNAPRWLPYRSGNSVNKHLRKNSSSLAYSVLRIEVELPWHCGTGLDYSGSRTATHQPRTCPM